MFPLRDVIPSRTFPGVTIAFIVLNALAFLYELGLSDRELSRFVFTWGVVPARFDLLSVFTSMFLHGGWMHVIGNMWFLWIFGDNVEDRMGHGRFAVFYLLAGAIAGVAHVWSDPASVVPTIGASGAVAGVMGAYFVLYPHSRILTLIPWIFLQIVELPATVLLGFWFVMQLFSAGTIAMTTNSQGGGVAFAAHVVGFIVGMGGVFLFRKRELDPWDRASYY